MILAVGQVQPLVVAWPRNAFIPLLRVERESFPHAIDPGIVADFRLIRCGSRSLSLADTEQIPTFHIIPSQSHRDALAWLLLKRALIVVCARGGSHQNMLAEIDAMALSDAFSLGLPQVGEVVEFIWRPIAE